MPVYPSYSMPMSNGYNPQFQNPYQQRMDFLQSYQQNLQQPVQMPVQNSQMNVIGKIVDSVEAVKAMDIPMDGLMYYFPKADGTEVFGKQWIVTEGRTRILTFKPILEAEANNLLNANEKAILSLSESVTGAFMERFDNLEKQIQELMTKSMTKTTASKTKKEVVENE